MSGLFGGGGGSAPAPVTPVASSGPKPKTLAQKLVAQQLNRRKPWLANSILGGGGDDASADGTAGGVAGGSDGDAGGMSA